jgi:MSHA pilin protein MshB
MKRNKNQKGFTIIELVVVILLLGILTATALPRFVDIQDDAHDAVVQGVLTGLVTSSGLFRAAWLASGQDDTVATYNNLRAFRSGYSLGDVAGNTPLSLVDSQDCADIYTNFLQGAGRPSIGVKTAAATALTTVKGATTDFVAYLRTGSSTLKRECYYVYTGQYTDSSLGGLPVLKYDAEDGTVALESAEL